MSAPVASASMSVPIAVSSSPANAGNESPDATFDALFATFESLAAAIVEPASAQPAANFAPGQQDPKTASTNVAPNPGGWIDQSEPPDANPQPRDGAAPTDASLNPGVWIAQIETPDANP